jgi:hypothetical protein
MSELIESNVDEQVLEDLQMLGHTVSTSAELTRLGVSDELATMLKALRKNPLDTVFDIMVKAEGDVRSFLEFLLVRFLKTKKDSIAAVYRRKRTDRVIEFVVAVKNNDLEAKFDINEFVLNYMQTRFQARFPMVIHYVKVERIASLIEVESIDLEG